MLLDNLNAHLNRIEKYIKQAEFNLRTTSVLGVKNLRTLCDRLKMKGNCDERQTLKEIISKWRDESFALSEHSEPSNSSECRDVYSKWTTFSKPKDFFSQDYEDSEIVENSEDESNFSNLCVRWNVRGNERINWEVGQRQFNPDVLFDQQKTPQGKGLLYDQVVLFGKKGADY